MLLAAFFLLLFFLNHQGADSPATAGEEPVKTAAAEKEAIETASKPMEVTILRSRTGGSETMDLEEYIYGVVAAEVPHTFESEAIRAQAIVARTYALSTLENGGALSDDAATCQAYSDTEMLQQRWGEDYEANQQRFQAAVNSTRGLVVTYEGALAKTYFHSTCGGKTSSAQEVWGGEIPYLQSVVCTWDREAPRYEERKSFSKQEVAKALDSAAEVAVPVSQGFTPSGRVATVSYQGRTIAATDFRRLLGLNSTNFTLTEEGDALTITTRGFGHGVGLCQYGANGMAKAGWKAEKIVAYYYQGVEIRAY